MLCMLGKDDEASSNCAVGAVEHFIRHYHSDVQAMVLCESFDADLRVLCLETAEEYYETLSDLVISSCAHELDSRLRHDLEGRLTIPRSRKVGGILREPETPLSSICYPRRLSGRSEKF
jgi:hypothetical protein